MYFDLLLLFMIFIAALFGYIHGFVRQVISLLTLLSIVFFAQPIAIWLKESSDWNWCKTSPQLVLWGLSSFFIVLFFLMVSGIVSMIRKGAGLTTADRWIGCALGTVKGFIFGLLVALVIHLVPEHAHGRFNELHADTENSIFVKMAGPMLDWHSLSTFKSLHEIKEHLKASEKKFVPREGPWARGGGVEPE
ncbi:MAG: hypothetical protein JWQ35_1978 [Bacteriovoracaceae bacterium]|nr:hypothetical protein [Bacteriovoracaceae bacterium]